MSNLEYTDAVWLRFFREFGFYTRMLRWLEEMRLRCARERTQFYCVNDYNDNLANPDPTTTDYLRGIQYGTNCTEEGRLYFRLTGGAGSYQLSLYKDTGGGGGDLVAQSTASYSAGNSQIPLTEQNSSGITAQLSLNPGVTTETDDIHQIEALNDWRLDIKDLWPDDGTVTDDAYSAQAAFRLVRRVEVLLSRAVAAVRQGFQEWALRASDNPVARGNVFTESNETSLLNEAKKVDSNGAVSRLRTGWLETLRSAMEDNTGGSGAQTIGNLTISGSAGTFDSNNDGQGTVASHTAEEHCPVGTWKFHCVAGLGTGDGGKERFNGSFKSSTDDTSFTFSGLRVGQSWKGPHGFGAITLTRSFTVTNTSPTSISALDSVSGENENNTNNGLLYWTVSGSTTDLTFSFYRDSAKAASDKVCEATGVDETGPDTDITASATNGSGLSLVFDCHADAAAADVGTIDLNFFNVQNSSDVPDKFEVATTSAGTGNTQLIIAKLLGYRLHSTGSPLLDEGLTAIAGTFYQRYAEDI